MSLGDIEKAIDFSNEIFELARENENINDTHQFMAALGICLGAVLQTLPKDIRKQKFREWVDIVTNMANEAE